MNWLPFAIELAQLLSGLVAKHSTNPKVVQAATLVSELIPEVSTLVPVAK